MSDLISLHPRQGLVLPLSYASHFDRYTVTYLIIVLICMISITLNLLRCVLWPILLNEEYNNSNNVFDYVCLCTYHIHAYK